MRFCRLLGVFAVLVIMVSAGPLSARASGGTTIGPVPISVLGHPRLCWQAGGNGSAVTLEHCDRMLQGQQWSLTPDGVLMNGNGYCLEAIPGGPLLVDFAGQCAGSPSQTWHYRSGRLAGLETCAAVAAPPVPGAEIVGSSCSRTVADTVAPATPQPRSPLPLIATGAARTPDDPPTWRQTPIS